MTVWIWFARTRGWYHFYPIKAAEESIIKPKIWPNLFRLLLLGCAQAHEICYMRMLMVCYKTLIVCHSTLYGSFSLLFICYNPLNVLNVGQARTCYWLCLLMILHFLCVTCSLCHAKGASSCQYKQIIIVCQFVLFYLILLSIIKRVSYCLFVIGMGYIFC